MIELTIDDLGVKKLMKDFPKETARAAEIAMDTAVTAARDAIKPSLPRYFDRPVPYTLNSIGVVRTKNHNLEASVGFKEPDRMTDHYLVPEVDGTFRKMKGFELALGRWFAPASSAKLDRYGNLPYGTVVQILSVLGKAEYKDGYDSNKTARSAKRNRKSRDYVMITKRNGKLIPGVYQRQQTGVGFGHKTKKTLPFGEFQKGRTRGQFSSVIRARGLKPVLFEIKRPKYAKRLPFYQVGRKVIWQTLGSTFVTEFNKRMAKRGR